MNKLEFTFSLLLRLRHMKGAVPWGKMLVLLALAKGPLRCRELRLMVSDINGPLETAKSEGLLVKLGERYHLTEAGRAAVTEILLPPPVKWQQPPQAAACGIDRRGAE